MIDPSQLAEWTRDVESWERDQSAYEEKHKFSPYHTQVRGVSIFLTTHVDVNSRVHSNDTGFSATVFSGKGGRNVAEDKTCCRQ